MRKQHRCLVCGKFLPNRTLTDKKRKYCSQKCAGIASRYDYKKAHRKHHHAK
ncbi:hypothetical protein KBH77_01275 [Patescibacteria group bacterium]|nr:hypothetical protein [Patescibacteria group bacterium]